MIYYHYTVILVGGNSVGSLKPNCTVPQTNAVTFSTADPVRENSSGGLQTIVLPKFVLSQTIATLSLLKTKIVRFAINNRGLEIRCSVRFLVEIQKCAKMRFQGILHP